MIFMYYMVLLTTATCCMEIDNSRSFEIWKDQGEYLITYDNQEYKPLSEHINDKEGCLACIEQGDSPQPIKFDCDDSSVIKNAIEALALRKPSSILKHFSAIDNDHFYDIYNFYSILVPTNTFKNYCYSIMILKAWLKNSRLFNVKAYMLTLDESKLCTSEYQAEKTARDNRLSEIHKIQEEKFTPQIKKERDALAKLNNKNAVLIQLLYEYIGNTFLLKQQEKIKGLEQKIVSEMAENGMTEKDLGTLKDFIVKKSIEKELNYREALSIPRNAIDADLEQKVLTMTQGALDYWLNRIIPIYQLEKKLALHTLDESKILNEEVLTIFLKELAFFKNDILDCSFIPVADLIKDVLLSKMSYIFGIELDNVQKVKIFCGFEAEKNYENIIESIHKIRKVFPSLKEIYFTDDNVGDLFSKEYLDEFNRVIFYPNYDEDLAFYSEKKPVHIFLQKNVYNTVLNKIKEHNKDLDITLKGITLKEIMKSAYYASYITGFLIMIWHLMWCKKDIHFCFKSGLFGIHLYLNRYNKCAPITYKIMKFSPIVLLLCMYGQWPSSPNIFKIPYGTPFLATTVTLAALFFCTNGMFNYCRNSSMILDESEQRAIRHQGDYIFPYDPEKI